MDGNMISATGQTAAAYWSEIASSLAMNPPVDASAPSSPSNSDSARDSLATWPQPAYLLSLSDAVTGGPRLTAEQTAGVSSCPPQQLQQPDGALAMQQAWQVCRSGRYDASAGYDKQVDDLIKSTSLMAMGLTNPEASVYDEQGRYVGGTLPDQLTGKERDYALQTLLAGLGLASFQTDDVPSVLNRENDIATTAIAARNDAQSMIRQVLEDNGIDPDRVSFDVAVAEDGTLSVTMPDSSKQSQALKLQLETALNADPDQTQAIAGKLKLSSALMQLQLQDKDTPPTDAVLSLLAEVQLNGSLGLLSSGTASSNQTDAQDLVDRYNSLIATKAVHPDVYAQAEGRITQALSTDAADSIDTGFSFSNGSLTDARSQSLAEKATVEAEKNARAVIRNYHSDTPDDDVIRFDNGETKISSFSFICDQNGIADFLGGKTSEGERLVGSALAAAKASVGSALSPATITRLLDGLAPEENSDTEDNPKIKVSYHNGRVSINVISDSDPSEQSEIKKTNQIR